jgi:type II secretory pathway component PulK
VALAIVLWFIAGMSLLVAGIVAQARVDTQMAQVHVARAKAVAAGDGAIQLMLASLLLERDGQTDSNDPAAGSFQLGDTQVTVVLTPVAGLIDINSASADVLLALFGMAGLGEDDARFVVENVLKSRSSMARPGKPGAAVPLDAMEDLLRVPGMSRTLLDVVRDFIVVGKPAQGSMDWSQSPAEILAVLDVVDSARADTLRARRDSASSRPGGRALARAYRADAIVRYGDKTWLRRRWIAMERGPASALPWSVVRTEPPRVLLEHSYLKGRSVDA